MGGDAVRISRVLLGIVVVLVAVGATSCVQPPPTETLYPTQTRSCAVNTGGQVECWGDNTWWAAGAVGPWNPVAVPTVVPGIAGAAQVTTDESRTCVRLAAGTVECWGAGVQQTDVFATVQIDGIDDAIAIDAGFRSTCVVHADGTVSCWGYTDSLGYQNPASLVPAAVAGIDDAVDVSVAGSTAGGYACVLRSSGGVSCWGGANNWGQLGDGTTTPSPVTPVEVLGIDDAVDISVGGGRACAALASGAVKCWGGLYSAGPSQIEATPTPAVIAGLDDVVQVSVGGATCAVRSSGSVACWGPNPWGGLGNGTRTASPTPVDVVNLVGATDVAVGQYHACAIAAASQVRCWGSNADGQLGNGTGGVWTRPVTALGINAVDIAASTD